MTLVLIQVQIGRIRQADGPHSLRVEDWRLELHEGEVEVGLSDLVARVEENVGVDNVPDLDGPVVEGREQVSVAQANLEPGKKGMLFSALTGKGTKIAEPSYIA